MITVKPLKRIKTSCTSRVSKYVVNNILHLSPYSLCALPCQNIGLGGILSLMASFFQNNNSYKNAWCLACLNHHKDLLRENADRDIGNDDGHDKPPITVLAPPLRITIPPLNSATLSHQATLAKKTSIPLKILFKYPAATDLPLYESGMNSFWRGGIQNLEKEMEAYELLSLSEENVDVINPEIPTMH